MTADERFWEKVDKTGECWLWTACVNQGGYGRFNANGRMWLAHRYAFALVAGAVPYGMVLDHACRNRRCVNPAHLQIVTRGENVRRGERGRMVTHCAQGHPYDADNTYIKPSNGTRMCRTCSTNRASARRKAARA